MGREDWGGGFGLGTARGAGEADGDGGGSGEPTDTAEEPVPSADGLEVSDEPRLRSDAQRIVDVLRAPGPSGPQRLTREDAEAINALVPLDLTEQELAEIQRRIATPSMAVVDLVESVTAAMLQVRPYGRRPQPVEEPPVEPVTTPDPEERPRRRRRRRRVRPRLATPAELTKYLQRVVTVDPVTGAVDAPTKFELIGGSYAVSGARAARVLGAEADTYHVLVAVRPLSFGPLPPQHLHLEVAASMKVPSGP